MTNIVKKYVIMENKIRMLMIRTRVIKKYTIWGVYHEENVQNGGNCKEDARRCVSKKFPFKRWLIKN